MRKSNGRWGAARLGWAWPGAARHGTAGMARYGMARQGKAWQGTAGTVINVSCMRDKYLVKGDKYGIR